MYNRGIILIVRTAIFIYRAFFSCSKIKLTQFSQFFFTDLDVLRRFRISEVGAIRFFWKLRYLDIDRCRNASNNGDLLYYGRLVGAHFCMFWILINIPHQKRVQNYWMQAKPNKDFLKGCSGIYFTGRRPQRRDDTLKLKKNFMSYPERTEVRCHLYSEIEPLGIFYWHSYTDQDIAIFPQKTL